MDNETKQQWKKDAELLKKDLQNRPKEIQYREKEIRFGGIQQALQPKADSTSFSTQDDQLLRRQLGL